MSDDPTISDDEARATDAYTERLDRLEQEAPALKRGQRRAEQRAAASDDESDAEPQAQTD